MSILQTLAVECLTEELSNFQPGAVIRCHLSNKAFSQMSLLLELPRLTVSAVIVKWKHQATQAHRTGPPCAEARKNPLSSVATLPTKFQTASGSNVSTITVCWELHEMGFHGVADKPETNMCNEMFDKRVSTYF